MAGYRCITSLRHTNGTPVTWVTGSTVGAFQGPQEITVTTPAVQFLGPLSMECKLPLPRSDGSYARLHSYFVRAVEEIP